MLLWWNGIHSALKMRHLRVCEFNSRQKYYRKRPEYAFIIKDSLTINTVTDTNKKTSRRLVKKQHLNMCLHGETHWVQTLKKVHFARMAKRLRHLVFTQAIVGSNPSACTTAPKCLHMEYFDS